MPDNDPLESLDNFPEGLHVDSLPASEVRRRGDRMRRRNTALATVGGVVAAAVFIGTPVALMSGNDKDTVDPAPSPPTPSVTEDGQPGWLTEIPAEFPVTEGMTDDRRAGRGRHRRLRPLRHVVPDLARAPPTSRPGAGATTARARCSAPSSSGRTTPLPTRRSTASRRPSRSCPQQPTQGGEEIIETKLVDFETGGDASLTFVQQVRGDDGLLSQLRHGRGDPGRQRRPGGLELRLGRRRRGDRDRDADPGRPVRDHARRDVRVLGRPVLDHRGASGPRTPRPRRRWRATPRDPGRLPARPGHGRRPTATTSGPPAETSRPARGRRLRHRRWAPASGVERLAVRRDRHRVPRDPRARHLRERRRGRSITDADPCQALAACPRQPPRPRPTTRPTRMLERTRGYRLLHLRAVHRRGHSAAVSTSSPGSASAVLVTLRGRRVPAERRSRPARTSLTETTLALAPGRCAS